MIQHFLEERFHKVVKMFAGLILKGDLTVSGTVTATSINSGGEGVEPAVNFKEYVAKITQSGTSAPTATVLRNTLGGVPVWTRGGTGSYVVTLTGAFTLNKTLVQLPSQNGTTIASDLHFFASPASANAINVVSYFEGSNSDDVLNTIISIRVYD